jgi:hypothetical protein
MARSAIPRNFDRENSLPTLSILTLSAKPHPGLATRFGRRHSRGTVCPGSGCSGFSGALRNRACGGNAPSSSFARPRSCRTHIVRAISARWTALSAQRSLISLDALSASGSNCRIASASITSFTAGKRSGLMIWLVTYHCQLTTVMPANR